LCYHGVSQDDEHLWSDLYVSQDHLRNRFLAIRDGGYTVLPLAEALSRLYAGTLPPRSVAITFDDGTYDFYSRAYPLLVEFGFPVTLYLTTYYCLHQYPVFTPFISYVLWCGRGRTVNIDGQTRSRVLIPFDARSRATLHDHIVADADARGLSVVEKAELACDIARQVGVPYERIAAHRILHLMRPEEAASLDPSLVDIQLHTHRHRSPQDRRLFERELRDNETAIREIRPDAPPPRHFCYPSGVHYPETVAWLREYGMMSATTCNPQLATPRSNPLLLPRFVDTMSISNAVFEAWLSGVASFAPRKRVQRSPLSDSDRTRGRGLAQRFAT
jgi:peptidoglycan/xylan/chitin deacetylase (PgdA/CDA1 family)